MFQGVKLSKSELIHFILLISPVTLVRNKEIRKRYRHLPDPSFGFQIPDIMAKSFSGIAIIVSKYYQSRTLFTIYTLLIHFSYTI
jgi:hypothetical protein